METNKVFKFAILRGSTTFFDPPKSDSSPFIQTLRSSSSRPELIRHAEEFANGEQFVQSNNSHLDILLKIHKVIERVATLTIDDIGNAVKSLDQLIDDIESSGTKQNLLDSVVAVHTLQRDDTHALDLANAYRTLELITKLSEDKSTTINTADTFELPYLGHKRFEHPSRAIEDNRSGQQNQAWEELTALTRADAKQKAERLKTQDDDQFVDQQRLEALSIDAQLLLQSHGLTSDRLNLKELQQLVLWRAADQNTRTLSGQKQIIHKGGTTVVVESDSKKPPAKDDFNLPPDGEISVSLLPNAVKLSVGELFYVQKTLDKYQLGEISHIENVLAGEHRSRTHRYLHRLEDTQVSAETKRNEREEHLESTDRFEVEQQSSNLTRAEMGLEAGGKISYSYGPTFSAEGTAKTTVNLAAEQTQKKSLTYAREIVSKTVDKTVEEIRKERQLKITDEIEETNLHEFESNPNQDTVGIYRWVDKIYNMQLVNYGKRMMLDITIPEPATHYLRALGLGYPEAALVEPEPFTLDPTDLNRYSLSYWAKKYNAEGLEAPPNKYATVAHTENAASEQIHDPIHKAANTPLTIPQGYLAIKAHITVEWLHTSADDVQANESGIPVDFPPMVRIGVGRKWITIRKDTINDNPMDDPSLWKKTVQLSSETGQLPLAMIMYVRGAGTVTVEIQCERTGLAMRNWQLRTFDLIHAAYQARVREYEEQKTLIELKAKNLKLDQLQSTTFEQIEHNELKRGTIELLSGESLGLINPLNISSNSTTLPSIHKPNADRLSELVLFFEQVFEWTNIQYSLYPYFWGHRSRWVEKLAADVSDSNHKAFLQAGSAHVIVPVKPGSELEVLYYVNYGRVWRGSGSVVFHQGISTIYHDILQEFQNHNPLDATDESVGDAWQVTVPTSLIMIQAGDDLPDMTPAD